MIRHFSLKNFRNYERADLDFAPARNLFIGGNGQGKSNLLEAIFYLAILRSFRTGKISELVQIGRREFCLEAELIDGRKRDLFRSEYNCENRRTLCINGERISKSSEFIGEITPIVFAPEDIRIISGPSSQRRSFLDMFISMEQAGYMRSLYCYTQALKQRNAVLRKHLPRASAEVFGAVMARYGIEIAHARMAAISELEQEMLRLFEKYPLIQREFKLNYQFDYQLDFESYNRTLNDNYLREIKRGFTTLGPHLDEMVCLYDRKLARNFASAGQTRLLALFFKIASLNILYRHVLENNSANNLIILVDDVTGELDVAAKQVFFEEISKASQTFFTFTEMPDEECFANSAVFNICDGRVAAP